MRKVAYIPYYANDPFELPLAVFDTVADTARFCCCCRDEIYDSIKFGDIIHGYKVDVVNFDVYIP